MRLCACGQPLEKWHDRCDVCATARRMELARLRAARSRFNDYHMPETEAEVDALLERQDALSRAARNRTRWNPTQVAS